MKPNQPGLVFSLVDRISKLKGPSTLIQLSEKSFMASPALIPKDSHAFLSSSKLLTLPEFQDFLLKSLEEPSEAKENFKESFTSLLKDLENLETIVQSQIKETRRLLLTILQANSSQLESLLESYECGELNEDDELLRSVEEFCQSGSHLLKEKTKFFQEQIRKNFRKIDSSFAKGLEKLRKSFQNEMMSFRDFQWIGEVLQKKLSKTPKLSVLYNMDRDGFTAASFHKNCDGKGATLTVVLTEGGKLLGGFTSKPWRSERQWVPESDSMAFLFSITHKEVYEQIKPDDSIYHYIDEGPTFGSASDLLIRMSVSNNKEKASLKKMSYGIFSSTYNTKNRSPESISDQKGYFQIQNFIVFLVE